MYANRQILACSMHKYIEESEKLAGKRFKKILIDRCNIRQKNLLKNINEYYTAAEVCMRAQGDSKR